MFPIIGIIYDAISQLINFVPNHSLGYNLLINDTMEKYFKTNQSLWDQRTEIHKDSDFYQMDAFKKGSTSLQAIELEGIAGEVKGRSLLHLMCHFGQDSLSLVRLGAKVTGIDLSPNAIQLAQSLNEELGLNARFIQSNILGLKEKLNEQFDIVYTSYGVLTWLPDLTEWASIVVHFLKPGGTFYMAEFHPMLYMYDHEKQQIGFRYFNKKDPYFEVEEGTYTDANANISHEEYFWCHSLHETIQPLLAQGLT